MLQYARPKNVVKLFAGVVGLAFERLGGSRPEAAPAPQDDLTAIEAKMAELAAAAIPVERSEMERADAEPVP